MTTWMSLTQLDAHLQACEPIGLRLRPFLHAWTVRDPAGLIARAPEELVEEGLEAARAWAGLVHEVPFLLRVVARHDGGFGLDVSFPVAGEGDAWLFDALAMLPLPEMTSLYFDTLASGPFGVRDVEADGVVYKGRARADAAAAARFATERLGRVHDVIAIASPEPRFVVAGPACGPFFSWIVTAADASDADRIAAANTRLYGAEFRVIQS